MAIADAMGVDKKTFYDAVTNSGAATVSPLFRDVARRIVDGKFDEPTFTLELLCKDTGLAIQMAKNAGFSPLITGFVQHYNEEARDGASPKRIRARSTNLSGNTTRRTGQRRRARAKGDES